MNKKFWMTYRKVMTPETIVGSWFVTPVLTLFFTNNGVFSLGITLIVIIATLFLENRYNDFVKNGK